nr:hypothetical protein [Tanacetum cinerariifolium]
MIILSSDISLQRINSSLETRKVKLLYQGKKLSELVEFLVYAYEDLRTFLFRPLPEETNIDPKDSRRNTKLADMGQHEASVTDPPELAPVYGKAQGVLRRKGLMEP